MVKKNYLILRVDHANTPCVHQLRGQGLYLPSRGQDSLPTKNISQTAHIITYQEAEVRIACQPRTYFK